MAEDPNSETGLRHALTGVFARDRRNGGERRKLSLWTFIKGGLNPRRRGDRRGGDSYHVDWHEPDLLFFAVTILFLSVIDALLTLTLLRHGGEEVNPVLRYVLSNHPESFAIIKMVLTGGGVLILVAIARARLFRVLRARTILQWCLLGYVALIAYEMWLLSRVF